jgi:carbon-monoxide dehydrogenase medium subunit
MSSLAFERPTTLEQALAAHAQSTNKTEGDGPRWLAGGQSLIAAMKLGLASPCLLIDLQQIPGLRDIQLDDHDGHAPTLHIGAMATHASVAASGTVRQFAPGLATLAAGIADAQVRQMGTLGGSLAHHDPAACWPAGVLAAGAIIVTNTREICADAFFQGVYGTALARDELITGVRFAALKGLHYLKFEQPASRFALTGVAVALTLDPTQPVRVAVTGLGLGVVRWPSVERLLGQNFSLPATPSDDIDLGRLEALTDLHASADYRRHLAWVLTRRCVVALGGEVRPQQPPAASDKRPDKPAADSADAAIPNGFGGVQTLIGEPARVWQTLLAPQHLQSSIPGCESLAQTRPDAYEAVVKVGLGPVAVRFKSEVLLQDLQPPKSMTLIFRGHAGALGASQGSARVRLEPINAAHTQLHWWVQVQLSGRLAQLGNRLVEAAARKLSVEFFERIGNALQADHGQGLHVSQQSASVPPPSLIKPQNAAWWRRWLQSLFSRFGK